MSTAPLSAETLTAPSRIDSAAPDLAVERAAAVLDEAGEIAGVAGFLFQQPRGEIEADLARLAHRELAVDGEGIVVRGAGGDAGEEGQAGAGARRNVAHVAEADELVDRDVIAEAAADIEQVDDGRDQRRAGGTETVVAERHPIVFAAGVAEHEGRLHRAVGAQQINDGVAGAGVELDARLGAAGVGVADVVRMDGRRHAGIGRAGRQP